MSKIYFRFSSMGAGKSSSLIQVAYNYEERGQHVLVAKPSVDTKSATGVVSRIGMSRDVDIVITPETKVREVFGAAVRKTLAETGDNIHCFLIDEAQFLEPEQIDDLFKIAVLDDVPVMAYGLRTDFQTKAFPGSSRLLEIAHSVEELKTICRCGRKAIFNARKLGNRYVFDGDQVQIDDGTSYTYESLCGVCYLDESGGKLG